jgi:hypothetical protein
MSSKKLHVGDFLETVKREVDEICQERGWSRDDQPKRNIAFEHWVARLLCLEDEGLETEPEDAVITPPDLGVDLVLEDTTRKHLLLVQCKYKGISGKKAVEEGEVSAFFEKHKQLCDRKYVNKYGSQDAIEALADFGEKMANGYSVRYLFVSTAIASDRTKELAGLNEQQYVSEGLNVKCELLDMYGLKAFYVKVFSADEKLPEMVRLHVRDDQYICKEDPYQTLVAVVSGNELRNLYMIHREALFAWNIRGYLGSRGINERIKRTAAEHPEHFFYFNNGVSAVCTEMDLDDKTNEVQAKNFQVINGAQTIGALYANGPQDGVEVLFRLTRASSVKTEKGFLREIIEYNNSQNLIKVSDFRSNDQIQKWLATKLGDQKPRGVLPKLHYVRKRGNKEGRSVGIRLEELAKIRYSFLVEPTLVHAAPYKLWTESEYGGVYETAFGENGEMVDLWSDAAFEECLVAIAFYRTIQDQIREEIGNDPKCRYLHRLRFHCLAMAGAAVREMDEEERHRLLHDEASFNRAFEAFWPKAFVSVGDTKELADADKMTLFAFVRSEDRWQRMLRWFLRREHATTVTKKRTRK